MAMALPLAWQIANIAGWVAFQITDIFENIGVVQEGMRAIARPLGLPDKPDAKELKVDARRRSRSRISASAMAARRA